MQEAGLGVVGGGGMDQATVVPHHEVAALPLVVVLEAILECVLVNLVQQGVALRRIDDSELY